MRATSPPHCAVPRKGYVCNGKKLLQILATDEFKMPRAVVLAMTACVVSAAYALDKMNKLYPEMATSQTAVKRTIRTFERRKRTHDSGTSGPMFNTRQRAEMVRKYKVGQVVSVRTKEDSACK